MKPAEKEVIRAGMEPYLVAEVRRQTRVLNDMRWTRHNLHAHGKGVYRADLTGRDGYQQLIKAQIVVIRRTLHALEGIRVVKKLYAGIRQADDAEPWTIENRCELCGEYESECVCVDTTDAVERCIKCGLTREEAASGKHSPYQGSTACYGDEWETSDNPGAGFRYPPPASDHQFEMVPCAS